VGDDQPLMRLAYPTFFLSGVTPMRQLFSRRTLALALIIPVLAACSDDTNDAGGGITAPTTVRTYSQVERLGNPLVSEVFFMKRDHGLHNSTAPATDVANDFGGKIKAFTNAFNRGPAIANTLAAVLVPDMLMVYPNRAANSSGWLSWALANGYGGRNLQDDVVDAGLTAIFGRLLDPTATALAGLTSDNISTSTRTYLTTFPYLEAER
jgi:Domain of unknown function (DUF4331)